MRADVGGVVWKHGLEGVCPGGRGAGGVAAPGRGPGVMGASVDGDQNERREEAVPKRLRRGHRGKRGFKGDWVVGRGVRSGTADAAASGVDSLVRVQRIGRHRGRRKEKGG